MSCELLFLEEYYPAFKKCPINNNTKMSYLKYNSFNKIISTMKDFLLLQIIIYNYIYFYIKTKIESGKNYLISIYE